MSSTNKTAELQLSQFIGTDIPSILTDYNGDMQKIDAGVREVKQATAGAIGDLSSVTARVTNAEQSISGLNSTVQGIATRVVTAEGEIDALQTSVGNLETAVNTKADASAVTALQDDVDDIEAVIPDTASTSNKLATMNDIPSIGGTRVRMAQKQVFNFSSYTSFAEILTAVSDYLTQNFSSGHDISPVIFTNYPTSYPMVYRANKAQPFYFEGFHRITDGLSWGTIDLSSDTPKWDVDYTTTYNDGLALNKIDVMTQTYPSTGSISIFGYELY